ncbi:NUDIX hydrolase [Streptomyces sp. NBC_01465]|uniref:NUDIX hydrolase n=1 Tax=Streptomyces sp. NBC_01465 TaxID=2903878 RepID=UPI002E361CF4|nr:NUDIX domain-containing protein [Streptomyces sp. NBC_01465]
MGELVDRVDENDRVIGVVERGEAIRNRWLHRVATTICHDRQGRMLIHRRPDDDTRFPGLYDVMAGGAVDVGESYEAAAERELAEEMGVRATVRPVVRFLMEGAISPYWLGVHETVIGGAIVADPREIAWHAWLTEAELATALREWTFVPDGQEAFRRYLDAKKAPTP